MDSSQIGKEILLYLEVNSDARLDDVLGGVKRRKKDVLATLKRLRKSRRISSYKSPKPRKRGRSTVYYRLVGAPEAERSETTERWGEGLNEQFVLEQMNHQTLYRREVLRREVLS